MTWPTGRAPLGDPRGIGRLELEATAVPGTYPVPEGRGRWRVSLHSRAFAVMSWQDTLVTEIVGARGRRLEQSWNAPARFTFTLDGAHPSALLVRELASDVYAWRWDDQTGRDVLMFRGVVAQSEDVITADSAVVVFTCHDYLAMLGRRFLTSGTPATFAQVDQDDIVWSFLSYTPRTSTGASFGTGRLPAPHPRPCAKQWHPPRVVDGAPRPFLPRGHRARRGA